MEDGTINSHRPTTLGGQPTLVISHAERQVLALWTVSLAGYAAPERPEATGVQAMSQPCPKARPRDITIWSSDRKGPPGRLSRQGPPVLRWAAYEAGKTHARVAAPDHAYYAAVKDRKNGKRAALSEAHKIVRQACHILTELGDDALTAA